ncbi:MAG: hypothetical protein J6J66_08420 [Clostridia bacterium]|nr:hypothetical protein [Clostridia bacterium]
MVDKILGADFSKIAGVYEKVYNGFFSGKVEAVWEKLMSLLSVIEPFLPYVLIALGAIELLFGKRLLGLQKFFGMFCIGYGAAVAYLVPVIPFEGIAKYAWIVGIVVGVVGILLRKFLYMVLYIGAFAFFPAWVLYSGQIAAASALAGNLIVAAAAGAVVAILAILLRKWVEIWGLSIFGAWAIVTVLDKPKYGIQIVDKICGLTVNQPVIIGFVLLGVLALIGIIFQTKTRKRY